MQSSQIDIDIEALIQVTVDELFNAVHQIRMTSKVTIAYELWRRLAFASLGQGKYKFRPEKGGRTRSLGLTGRRATPTLTTSAHTPRSRKTKSLAPLILPRRLPTTDLTADDLWQALMQDDGQKMGLQTAVSAYKSHPFREKMIFLRGEAHKHIRTLLQPDRLPQLTLDTFNKHIWQLGTVTYQGTRARIDALDVETLLQGVPLADVQATYEKGDLTIQGNQTWAQVKRPCPLLQPPNPNSRVKMYPPHRSQWRS